MTNLLENGYNWSLYLSSTKPYCIYSYKLHRRTIMCAIVTFCIHALANRRFFIQKERFQINLHDILDFHLQKPLHVFNL